LLDVNTERLVWCTFVSIKIIGFLKFHGTVQIRRFVNFWKCKSRGRGHAVLYGINFQLSGRRLSYEGYIC